MTSPMDQPPLKIGEPTAKWRDNLGVVKMQLSMVCVWFYLWNNNLSLSTFPGTLFFSLGGNIKSRMDAFNGNYCWNIWLHFSLCQLRKIVENGIAVKWSIWCLLFHRICPTWVEAFEGKISIISELLKSDKLVTNLTQYFDSIRNGWKIGEWRICNK